MGEKETASNVVAAVASFILPGLGQLLQGRTYIGLVHFILAAALWIMYFGWIVHIWSVIDAARYKQIE